jgi:putative transposase
MHYKVRESGRVVTRAIYNILGVDIEEKKDLIGMYVSETEGAKFWLWLSVITDLKNTGVGDILIACIDGLKSDRRSGLSRSYYNSLSFDPNPNLCSTPNS